MAPVHRRTCVRPIRSAFEISTVSGMNSAMDKDSVAEILQEIGVLLELKGENPFKTRSYSAAARTLEALEEPLDLLVKEGRLGSLKGIGDALQQKITELVTTGKLEYYDKLRASFPPGLFDLLELQGLGPKKVKALHDTLQVDSIESLERACVEGRVAGLTGFGEKSQAKILEAIAFRKQFASKHRLDQALRVAEPVLESLRGHPDVTRCSLAGSARRWKEIVGDLDFLASSRNPKAVLAYFVQQPGVLQVLAHGETKASVVLEGGIQADLRVVSDPEFPFALAYFTGSKEHNIVMRQRAIERGLRLNEYGLFRSLEETRDPHLLQSCATEEEIFQALDLQFIPPELREDLGEFDVASAGRLPRLIEWTDLRGSLHNHTHWSDGAESLEEVASHVHELGCDYWAITDHSRSSFQARGLTPERLREQRVEINRINQSFADEGSDFRLLAGSEVDILSEGRLDYDDDVLAELDVVVASIHQGFSQNEAEMTKRLINAAQNPYVHMLGHLTGRLLLKREAYAVNQRAVIDACAETGTWIELNASPQRFDMDWRLWAYARKKGVRCVINCDAHQAGHVGYLRLGAQLARKGWLTKEEVVNTLPLTQLRQALQAKRH